MSKPRRRPTREEIKRKRKQKKWAENVLRARSKLPILLNRLSKITDPRNPKKIKHKLTVLMIYGILTFVLQMEVQALFDR